MFLFLYTLPPTVYAAEPIIARYMRIDLPGDGRVLSLAEVQIYNGEKLISAFGKAKQVTTFSSATAEKAIDGKVSGNFFGGSVTSTESGSFPWWELDLGADQLITKIVIHNRTDCCAERINPAKINLRNGEQQVVWQASIESTRARYDFDVDQTTTSVTPLGRNLLRNATLRQSTNPPLPDYWDLHHAATLKFKDLHSQYGLDETVTPPFPGVGVLKIVNSEDDFRYVILMPTKIQSALPGGDYTYSVYVKADRNAAITTTKAWAVGPEITKKVSTDWRRYTFTFKERGGASSLQPVIYFPKKGTYFVAAPQLEEGATATPFDAIYGGGKPQTVLGSATQKLKAWVHSTLEHEANRKEPIGAFQSLIEYDYYTSQDSARLWLSSSHKVGFKVDIVCVNSGIAAEVFFKKSLLLSAEGSIYVDVPIENLPPGSHRCSINAYERGASSAISNVFIKKLKPNPVEVRANNVKRVFAINNAPFYIIGMYIVAGDIPDWYFRDIKEHGINTVFYNRQPNSDDEYDIKNIKSVVMAAAKCDLKVIIGLSMAGAKPTDWRRKTSAFLALIDQLKVYPQIIGWYPVDEPSANTWRDSELMDVYSIIKKADPYRLVFVNWAYDGVPKQVGQQPRGTLNATDVYAIDYYPFTAPSHSLSGFTEITTRAVLTARLYNKPFFSWLQLYGGNDAWREPTGAELNYMAFANFIYGGMIGYFDTKSNSAATWRRLRTINLQGKELAQKTFLSEDAFQLLQPIASDKFLFTAWKKGASIFLIVVNRDSVLSEFSYDVSSLTHGAPIVSVRSMFEDLRVKMVNRHIDEWLAPYESKVYEIVSR